MKSASQASLKTNLGHETQLLKAIHRRGAKGYDSRRDQDLAAVPSKRRSLGSTSGPPVKELLLCSSPGLTAPLEPAQPKLRDVRANGDRRQQQIWRLPGRYECFGRSLEEDGEVMWQGGVT